MTAVRPEASQTDGAHSAELLRVNVAASTGSVSLRTLMRSPYLSALATAASGFQFSTYRPTQRDDRSFVAYLFREGKILNLPAPRQLTAGEMAERERLAELFGRGKPASEVLLEDRGSR
jgi:hypothetical protein